MVKLFISFFLLASSVHAAGLNLQEAFAKTLQYFPTDKINDYLTDIASTQKKRAWGGLGPRVQLQASHLRQEEAPIFERGFGQVTQNQLQIRLDQPIFQGLREYAALSIAQNQLGQQRHQQQWQRVLLFQEMASAYFQLGILFNQKKQTKKRVALLADRVSQINKWVRIGRSRKSELLQAKTQLRQTQADLQGIEAQLARQKESLLFFTGPELSSKLNSPLSLNHDPTPPGLQKGPKELEEKLKLSPLWKLLEDSVKIQEQQIKLARGQMLPQVNVQGNYYIERGGALQDVSWDASINVSVPLFNATQFRRDVQIEKLRLEQIKLQNQREKMQFQRDLIASYHEFNRSAEQYGLQKNAVEAAKSNWNQLRADYKLGLVANLDVLDALNSYIQSETIQENLKIQLYSLYWTIQSLAGELP